jgi:uncharacterized protein (TIRG00374 family)
VEALRRRTRIVIMILLAVLILAALVWRADPEDVAEHIAMADLWLIAAVVGLYFLNTLAKIIRWYALVHDDAHPVPFGRVAMYFLIGLAVNNTTPGRIAGEPVRAYLLRAGNDYPMGRGMASIFFEKTMDTIVTIFLAVLGVVLLIRVISGDAVASLLLSVAIIAVLMGGLIVFIAFPAGPRKVAQWLFGRMRRKGEEGRAARLERVVTGFLGAFEGGVKEIARDRTRALSCTGLTVFIWLNEAVRLWLVFLALGSNESFELMMVAVCLASYAALLIPLGAGNSTAIVVICILAGIEGDLATSASILAIMTSIWLSVPLGAGAMTVAGMKMDRIPSPRELMAGVSSQSTEKEPPASDGGVSVEPQPRP